MTEEAKRCVEALRDNINNGFLLVGGFNGSVHASEIIHLIESLSAQLEQVENERDGMNIMLAQAQAMLETRTKERDAAIRDIDEAAPCFACIRFERNGGDCIGAHVCTDDILQDALGGKYADYYWQWRGVQEE